MAVTSFIFELENRSKAQNVGNSIGHYLFYSTSDTTSGYKAVLDLKVAAISKDSKYIK